jgi:hypothetical protein
MRVHIFSGLLEGERNVGAYPNFIVDILTINEINIMASFFFCSLDLRK